MNRTGENLQRIANKVTDVAASVCHDACEADEEGIFYLPFIIVCAIKDHYLIGSTLHFDGHQSPDDVAKVLRMTADHLEGKGPPPDEVIRGSYLQ